MTDKQKLELIMELIDTADNVWEYKNPEPKLAVFDVLLNYIRKIVTYDN